MARACHCYWRTSVASAFDTNLVERWDKAIFFFTSIAMEVSKTVFYEKKNAKTNATRRSCPPRLINRASEVWQINKNRRKQNFQKLSTASYMPWKAYLLKTLKYLTRTNIFQAKLIVTSQNGDILIATGAPVKHCIFGPVPREGQWYSLRTGSAISQLRRQYKMYDELLNFWRKN